MKLKLRTWRESKSWTQQRLADELGCDLSTVKRYESATRDPDGDTKRRIFFLSDGAVTPDGFYDVAGWQAELEASRARLIERAAA